MTHRSRIRGPAVALSLVALAGFAAGCGRFGGAPTHAALNNVGSYRLGVAIVPDPPTTGENVMTVVVEDALGRAVEGATVDIVVSMPAMGAMPAMESRGRVREIGHGVYRAAYGLAMAGDWDVRVRVRPKGHVPSDGTWRISTSRSGAEFVGETEPPPGGTAGGAAASDHGSGASPSEAMSAISVDAARRQSLGIRVEPALERDLVAEVRAAGRVAYDETRRAEVSIKFSGWVRAIHANFLGAPVRRGEALFEIYSPELWAAQQEFIEARTAAREDSARGGAEGADLAEAARRRLLLWDLGSADIDAIARSSRPRETLPVRAPVSGVVTEKRVVLGSPVTAGQVLYAIAPTDPVWVLASVDEQDLPLVHAGQRVTLLVPGGGGRERWGRVAFVAPDLAADSRTGTLRVEVPNGDGQLRPGTYLDVRLSVPLGRRLAVPDAAVLPTGERHIVFVDLGGGRLVPRDVTLGARAGDWVEVRAGLVAGDAIVTSGNFLVAAESRLRSAAAGR